MAAEKYALDERLLERLPPADRRRAILALATAAGNARDNPLWGFDPLNPMGSGRPHLPQHRWLGAWDMPDGRRTKFRMLPGGNRGGKTTTGDLADILDLVDRDVVPPHLQQYKRFDPPITMYIVAPSDRAVRNIHLPLFRRWCPKGQLVGNSVDKAFNKEYSFLAFKNGSVAQFMTQRMDVDVFQGTALHVVHFDEEPLYDHGQAIFTECLQRLVDYNGELRLTFTPLHGMTWVFDSLYEPWASQQADPENAVEGYADVTWEGHRFPVYVHTVDQDDNPVLEEEGKAAALALARNDAERRARKSGRFVSFAGRIYADFSRARHVVPDAVVDERVRRGFDHLLVGLDPGFRHQAGLVWAGVDADGVWVIDELALERTVIPEVVAEYELRRTSRGFPPVVAIADPAIARVDSQTGKTDQQAYAEAGLPARPGNNVVQTGIRALQTLFFRDRIHIAARCDEVVRQLEKYRWVTPARSQHDAPDKPVKRDDHLLDALRYAVMSLPIPEVSGLEAERKSRSQRAVEADLRRARRHARGGLQEVGR